MKRVVYLILVSLLAFTSCKKDSNPTSPTEEAATVTYAGKVYHTVKIGNQTWLKENLDVGVMIDSMQNPSDNGTIEKYCYRNDTANCSKYGGLYRWDEAMAYDTANGAKGICPEGWHIPSKAEFGTLAAAVHNNSNSLKAIGEGMGSGAGTDSSGFSALLAGGGNNSSGFPSEFYGLGEYAFFWSSTAGGAIDSYFLYLYGFGSGSHLVNNGKRFGNSVRCIKN